MSSTADAVIVGGGIVGTSVAFHLASLGIGRVVLCERRFLAAGATGKSGALVRMHYTNEPEARLAFASLPYFAHWSDMVGYGTAGFLNTGLLRIVSRENEAKLRANVAMLRQVGVDTSVVGSDDVRQIAPSWNAQDIAAAAFEPKSGCADPVATTHAFAGKARQLGAEIRLHTAVTAIRVREGKAQGVDTSTGSIESPVIVIAGGAWAIPLLRQTGVDLPLQAVRVQVALFRRPQPPTAPHPICIDGINEIWLRPEGPEWGSTLAGISHRQLMPDPDALDEGVDGDYVQRVRERLTRRLPEIEDLAMRGGWAGVITMSGDGKPVLDRHPEVEGIWFATGDSGTSFKTAPAVGRAIAEWIIYGHPKIVDLRPFRAGRFADGHPLVGDHEYGDHEADLARVRNVMVG
jgi:sarcosine oxidase, subunit beta